VRRTNKNKMQIKKTKIEFILLVAIFQVFLLMNMVIANSYLIHQTGPLIEDLKITEKNRFKDLVRLGLNLLTGFLSLKQIGIVSAQEVSLHCCLETNEGAVCQDIISGTASSTHPKSCANPVPTSCDNVPDCEKGCCYDSILGLCSTGSSRKKCEVDGGEWYSGASCLIQQCQQGCCVLGSNTEFTTEKGCEWLSLQQGFDKDFKDISGELECLILSASQDEGACVLEAGRCNFVTEVECLERQGDFYDVYCSDDQLKEFGVICEEKDHVGCYDNNIYWFDSCGNRENIEEECNYPSKKCSEDNGNFICKDLGCENAQANVRTKDRLNGERWCIYDSYIGDGKDTAGSEHWLAYCYEGEVEIDRCGEYRGHVCAQSEIEEGGKTFSQASCVGNIGIECLAYNNEEATMEEDCNENTHCVIKNINVDKNFKFDICVPRYPRGFDLLQPSVSCSMINELKCTVLYMKDWKGEWDCEENCHCVQGDDPKNVKASKKFVEQMNDLCMSLGECGTHVNYIGKGTDNIKATGSLAGVSWEDYKDYADPVEGQYVELQDIDDFLSSIFGTDWDPEWDEESKVSEAVDVLGTISGALGIYAIGRVYLPTTKIGASLGLVKMKLAGLGAATIGAAIGAAAGAKLAEYLEISGDAATAMTIAGGTAGASIGYMIIESWAPSLGFWGVIVPIIVIIYIWAIGWGETKEKTVSFTCMPWQAPTFSGFAEAQSNCEKCNEDPLRPCIEYRCNALGQVCKLLNDDTENPACESIPYEPNPPVITAKEVITEGYEFRNNESKRVEIISSSGDECIPEFASVLFSLGTDEFAQCKFDFQQTATYDDMEDNFPLEENRFTEEHTFNIFMPSIDSLYIYDVGGDITKMYGNMNLYIRCQDAWENFNIDEYVVNFCIHSGPDLTAAWIRRFSPKDESFLKYGITEIPVTIHLNEPASCKYDVVGGKSYDEMLYSMDCKTDLDDMELYGWPCSTTLTNLTNGENKFYIKCKDKPWIDELTEEEIEDYEEEFGEEYLERNINSQDYVYTLHVSENELKIDSVLPQGEIESGFEPVSVDLKVETSGGIENGKSTCFYEWANNWIRFKDTFSKSHKQPGLNLMGGNFKIPIMCNDDAENVVYGNASFSINVDSLPPTAVRIYRYGSSLEIITDEEAECYYDFNKCSFNIDNSTSMTIGFSKKHSAGWLIGKTYHIKCKDIWGNANPNCMIKVSPSFFG